MRNGIEHAHGKRVGPAGNDDPQRAEYAEQLRSGWANFFDPVMSSCPWCESDAIKFRIRLTDMQQLKPGIFDMYDCLACKHVFQNPRLTETGLAYYYRDFYDGIGQKTWDAVFEYSRAAYRARVRMLDGLAHPSTWLDVGGGHGHFCRDARKLLPDTHFSGLDQSQEIERARERGWIDTAYTTPFRKFTEERESVFDVVSMSHYLEHTISPKDEIAAARKVIRKGGHLLIELPNAESRYSRFYGRFWYGWMAPQHLHMMPWRNVCRFLEECGYEVLRVETGKANSAVDNMAAVTTALSHYLPPPPHWPWLQRRVTFGDRLLRKGGMALSAPVAALAFVADFLLHQAISRSGGGNTYRILAVRH
jgi:ubiquinone/menaquinone biosynthesis C-methylase UbiE